MVKCTEPSPSVSFLRFGLVRFIPCKFFQMGDKGAERQKDRKTKRLKESKAQKQTGMDTKVEKGRERDGEKEREIWKNIKAWRQRYRTTHTQRKRNMEKHKVMEAEI